MPETLFTDLTCPLVDKRFLWWKWQEHSHSYVEVCRWSQPGHYSTFFFKKRFCTKCWATDIESFEASGP